MAQAGFTPIQLYYSNTATNVPATLANGELAINQADGKLFYRNNSGVVTQYVSGVSSVAFSAGTTGFSVTGSPITSSGTITLAGTLAVANGGTGLTATPANGQLDIGNGTGFTRGTLTAGSGITITNASGSITIASTGGGGSVTSVDMSVPAFLSVSGNPITGAGTLAVTYSGTALPVANGGTGQTSYTDGQLLIGNSTGNTLAKSTLTAGSGITITNGSGTITIAASGGGGGVSAVTATSPVASSGGATPNISLSAGYGDTLNPYASKTANFVLAAPNGSAGVPTFRAVAVADIPTLNQNTTGTAGGLSATLAVTSGGTGQTTYTDGQLLIGNSTGNTLTKSTLTAGSGITITNGSGAITIAASGGGVTGFTTALNTAAPNATNNVSSITASGGTTNQFIAIVPKGTGGIIASIPDSTPAGGNVRGGGAVDFQQARGDADMVASGAWSTISGGLWNKASGNYSVVAGGELCVSSGGYTHTSGYKAQATAVLARAHGFGAVGFAKGVDALGLADTYNVPETTAPQASRQVLACKTTNATPTVLTADNAALAATNSHTIRANSIYYFTVYVAAGVTGGGNAKVWRLEGGIKAGATAGTTVLIGAVTKNVVAADAGASTWDVSVTADTTFGCLVVTGTGQASTSINWASLVTSVQTIFV